MSRIKIATLTAARELTSDEMRQTVGGSGSTDTSVEPANHDLFETHKPGSKHRKRKRGKKPILGM